MGWSQDSSLSFRGAEGKLKVSEGCPLQRGNRQGGAGVGRGSPPPLVRTLRVVKAFTGLGAQRPGGRLPGGGPAFFIRKQGERIAGGSPPAPPHFQDRSLLARSIFWVACPLPRSLSGLCAPDQIWKRIFGKNFLAGFFPTLSHRPPTHASQPAQLGGGPLPTGRGRAAGQDTKKRDTPKDIPNQSGESRGEKLSPLVFFPPFLT